MSKGYLYLDGLYIEEVPPHWPEAAKAPGKWSLLIDRDDWITDDLATFRRKIDVFWPVVNGARQKQTPPSRAAGGGSDLMAGL
jgi:hypothetical protein